MMVLEVGGGPSLEVRGTLNWVRALLITQSQYLIPWPRSTSSVRAHEGPCNFDQ